MVYLSPLSLLRNHPMNNNQVGHLHTIDECGLNDFVADKAGALNVIEQLRGRVKQRWTFDLVKQYVWALYKKYGLNQTYKLPTTLPVVRARKLDFCEREFWPKFKSDLGARKSEDIKDYGRCHSPGISVGYCALYEDIALTEARAELDDCYVITFFEPVKNFLVAPVGELDFFRRTGETYLGSAIPSSSVCYAQALDKENGDLRAMVDAFFADEFMRPANNDSDYRLTAAYAHVLMSDTTPIAGAKIDAIFYPSVAFHAGYNFAFRQSFMQEKMMPITQKTKIVKISDVLGYGIFQSETLATLKKCDAEGLLEWS
jgi:RES domain